MIRRGKTVRLATPDDEKLWDQLVSHPIQSWAWGEFRKSMGVDVVRLIAERNWKPIAGWQITFHHIPATPFRIGYFPKGPILTKTMVNEIASYARQKHAFFVQLEPNVTVEEGKAMRRVSLPPAHRSLFTKYNFILDITPPEKDLLRSMHHKTRYNIKVATRHGVVVSEESSAEGFAQYLQLLRETTKRQTFLAHNEMYHTRMWETMSRAGIAKLFIARVKGMAVAAWIIFVFGDTMYYPYGTSSRERREAMAPNLLLWEIIRWGKTKGYKNFDLWGALGPHPDEKDPWYGFHRFKEGYRPKHVEYIGSFDLVVNSLGYRLYQIADRIRWAWLGRKK